MKTLRYLVKRNTKLFFKDKGMFFTSLITPAILLVLYISFLANVFRDAFKSVFPVGVSISSELIDACVGAQLISSILAVSCVTVAFCSNMLMVQDKANRTRSDFDVSPVKPSVLAISYYIATLLTTLIVCLTAMALCMIYIASVGWYMSVGDVLFLLLDVVLLTLFGTALSSIINFFLSSQGQISAVGTIVSSGYGFVCGAYMPISQFSEGLQKVISFLPGTYGTSLIRNHAIRGALSQMESEGVPSEMITALRDSMDCNLYFFENKVEIGAMYVVLATTVAVLLSVYVFMNVLKGKRSN